MALSASADDRHAIHPGDHIVLIVEDDAMFASVLLELARERGFKGVIAQDGAGALSLAHRFKPHAITLDIGLPDMDGWALLDLLKNDPRTRHIPIHVISVNDEKKRGLRAGAFGFLEKPVEREGLMRALERSKEFITRPVRNLLLVEDDENQRASITALLSEEDVKVFGVGTAAAALEALTGGRFDCAIIDLGLPDIGGSELIEQIRASQGGEELPIIVYTGRELTAAEEQQLRQTASTIILKDTRSSERLLDETALFLHRAIASVPAERADPGRAEGRGVAPGVSRHPGRRRPAQHLLAHERPGAARARGPVRGERAGRHRAAQDQPEHRCDVGRHHDARDGRLRDDARRSGLSPPSGACRSSR